MRREVRRACRRLPSSTRHPKRVPPPESGDRSNTSSALNRANESRRRARDLGAYWAWRRQLAPYAGSRVTTAGWPTPRALVRGAGDGSRTPGTAWKFSTPLLYHKLYSHRFTATTNNARYNLALPSLSRPLDLVSLPTIPLSAIASIRPPIWIDHLAGSQPRPSSCAN